MTLNSRERVLTAVARREPDRVPIYLWLTPHIVERFRAERGAEDPEDHLGMDIRMAPYAALAESSDFARYTAGYPPGTTVDEWGCGTFPVGYYHFTKAVAPLDDRATVSDIEGYPFPLREPDIAAMGRTVAELRAKGVAVCSNYECGTFEQGHALMGMEVLLTAMCAEPAVAQVLFERIAEIKARIAAAYVKAGVDVLFIGDDIGFQNGPAMNPELWREFLIPPLCRIIAAARAVRADIPIAYHSCGHIEFAVEGLLDAGIDILQSVQPEANDVAALKRRFGDRLAFWGGVGSQSTMSHGTPDDVRNEVRHLMATLGRGGGYICSPAHFVEPESPLENIDAFIEAIQEYGGY